MIGISTEEFVRTITLDRPDAMNALCPELVDSLIDAMTEAERDAKVRVVVLTGAGKAFSVGIDLRCLTALEMPENRRLVYERLPVMFGRFIDFPKPLIIAVNGMGIGFGATICGLADIVIMADSAKLRAPFTSLGVVPEGTSTHSFSRIMGRQRASWVLLSSDWMDAAFCKECGLAFDVVPDDYLMGAARARARTIASMPPESLYRTKKLMMDDDRAALRKANRDEFEQFWRAVDEPAHKEAIAAFLEKRTPDFSKL